MRKATDTELRKKVCGRLKTLRVTLGLTQDKAGKALGMTRQGYASIESGRGLPSLESLIRISIYYNASVDWIIGLSESEPECIKQHKNELKENITDEIERLQKMLKEIEK